MTIISQDYADAGSFLQMMTASHAKWASRPNWVFRGESDADWKLIPSVLRRHPKHLLTPWERQNMQLPSGLQNTSVESANILRRQGEASLVLQFREHADRAGLAIPDDSARLRAWREVEKLIGASPAGAFGAGLPLVPQQAWPPLELLSVVALAQHSGIPTRLLDWSWKPRVAAYFAAKGIFKLPSDADVSKRRIAVWALNVDALHYLFMADAAVEIVQAPQATNRNLAAQAGVFLVARTQHEDVGIDSLIVERAEANGFFPVGDVIQKLTLPASEARALMGGLAYEHVSAATVFPDYAGVVESIREASWWDAQV